MAFRFFPGFFVLYDVPERPTTLYELQVSPYEDLVIDRETCNTISDSFATRKIPSRLDMPEIEVILTKEPAPSGPFGAKDVGELGMTNVAPAVTNAIGFGIHSLPMTPEKVLEGLKA